MDGNEGIWMDIDGDRWVWRGVDGCGGIWRDMGGYGFIWRELDGMDVPTSLNMGIKSFLSQHGLLLRLCLLLSCR